jgi:hypothetical protein
MSSSIAKEKAVEFSHEAIPLKIGMSLQISFHRYYPHRSVACGIFSA